MRRFQISLAHRMVVLILAGAGSVLLGVLGYQYGHQRERSLELAVRAGDTQAQSVALQIDSSLGRAEALVGQTALLLKDKELRRADTADLIRRTLERHPRLGGMAVALAESAAGASDFKILYGWRQGSGVAVEDRPDPAADYQSDWFRQPCEGRAATWIEPYFDVQAGTTMVTYAVPIMRGEEVAAVVTCDLALDYIRGVLATLPLGPEETVALLSRRGTFVAHPTHPELEMKETIFSLAGAQAEPEAKESLERLGRAMIGGASGHLSYRRLFGESLGVEYASYAVVPSTGWALGLFRPERQVLAPLDRLNRVALVGAAVSLGLLLIPALGIAWSVARPLRRLAEASQSLAGGDFDAVLPVVRHQDEVARLTAAFEQMRQDLRRYIADLTATTAARARLAGELSAAREIQLSLLPKVFSPFPGHPEIDLYATLVSAAEVGGDLYDFAWLDEDHLYVAIGDVSGKGVAASLLMAVGKTLLKAAVQHWRDPGLALAQVNAELEEDNEACMFITLFCGILDLRSGVMSYANAGHNPPLLARLGGALVVLDEQPDAPLGIWPDTVYQNRSRQLQTGDVLLLFSDGVTEAMNEAFAEFGDERLRDFLRGAAGQEVRSLLEALGVAVQAHAAGAPQSDDVTALALRYRARAAAAGEVDVMRNAVGRAPDARLDLPNRLEELPQLVAWIEAQVVALGIPAGMLGTLNLVLEEWVVNVISYGYADGGRHGIDIGLWREAAGVRLMVVDDAVAFDPTARAEVDTSLPLEDRPIGGLGIHFMRQTMDVFSYARCGQRNVVTLEKRFAAG